MKNTILIILTALAISACSINLNDLHRDTIQGTQRLDQRMKKVQFYLSHELVLERSLSREKSNVRDGKIIVEKAGDVERIRIPAESPGVFVFSPDGEKMAISFSENDQAFLMFGPNPNENNRYTLLGKNWNRNYGEVTYRNKTYYVSRRSAMTGLLVDLEYNQQTRERRETLRGRRIDR